jgi:hypothetical protein
MDTFACTEHGRDFRDRRAVIEHIRGYHVSFIRRPGRPGDVDSHGHMWYCFECDSRTLNDHWSYDSDNVMWGHLAQSHSGVFDSIVW